MSPFATTLIVLACLLIGGVALGVLGICLAARQQRRRYDDELLIIKPPRRYVDPDGRSDYRPELRDIAAQRREGR